MIKLLILENDDEFCKKLIEKFSIIENYKVCAFAGTGAAVFDYVNQYRPDVIILNLVLGGMDGFSILDYLKENFPDCNAIVVSDISNHKIVSSAITHGAKYYFVKPVSIESIVSRVQEILIENDKQILSIQSNDRKRGNSLDEKISNIFISIGIPPHIKGYGYLREGIKMVVSSPSIINNVTKELYPSIGEKFQTSASKVERAIRHAIEVAWNRGRIDAINAIFGVRVYIGSERPTNSEFIALVADKLILEELV